jgi:hypothetical protein
MNGNILIRWSLKSKGITMQGKQNRKGPSGATEFNKIWNFLQNGKEGSVRFDNKAYDIECYMLEKGRLRLRVMKGLPNFENTWVMRLPRGGKYKGDKDYAGFDGGSRFTATLGDEDVIVDIVDYFRPDGALRRVNLKFLSINEAVV